ncbi:MAG: carboxypeptidase regulatory-like domain-containing protein [Candidatus Riflebacteria bacterium]|nr:carboxypeptidase regulatory-like domain-containing protein [Candidatus Riflebacteria bacterium]
MFSRKVACSIAILIISFSSFFLPGCSNDSGNDTQTSSLSAESPEAAVIKIVKQWGSSNITPTLAQRDTTGILAASSSLGTVTFRDLSGNEWKFEILSVLRTSATTASIFASYSFSSYPDSVMEVTFKMVLNQGEWLLDDLIIEKLPEVVSIRKGVVEGYITDEISKQPIAGVAVQIIGDGYEKATVSDAKGFYQFYGLPPGTYSLVFKRDGYVIKTIPNVSPAA